MTSRFKALLEQVQTDAEVRAWLDTQSLKTVKAKDGKAWAGTSVDLQDRNLTKLGVRFAKLEKHLVLTDNHLTDLTGLPEDEIGGELYVGFNELVTLKGCPRKIGGSMSISGNKKLRSLEGCPDTVGGSFMAIHCAIETLDHFPTEVDGNIQLQNNHIKDVGALRKRLKKMDGTLFIGGNPVEKIMGVLLIDGLKKISVTPKNGPIDHELEAVVRILSKYIGKGRAGLLDAASELSDHNLDKFSAL